MLSLVRLRSNEHGPGKALAWVSLLLALGAGAVLALMMYLIFADVVLRYVFNAPITGSVEIIYCLMGLLVCMGFGLCTYENEHVRVDILTAIMPPPLRAACDLVAHVLSVLAAGLISWRLSITAVDQTREMNETLVLALPVWLVALIMAACSTLLVLNLTLHLAGAWRHVFRRPARR